MSLPLTQSAAVDKVLRRVDTGDDIEDPSHYSIENPKQKAEHDRKLKEPKLRNRKSVQQNNNSLNEIHVIIVNVTNCKNN